MSKILQILFLVLVIISCKVEEKSQQVCLVNGTDHNIMFSAFDGGHFRAVGSYYCTESDAGSTFQWGASYPIKEMANTTTPALFAKWEGSFKVPSNNYEFVFKADSATLIYDFRDPYVGHYSCNCNTVELAGNDIVNNFDDTETVVISKSARINELEIVLNSFYTGTASFSESLYHFQLSGDGFGQINPFSGIGFQVSKFLPNVSIKQVKKCSGKKI